MKYLLAFLLIVSLNKPSKAEAIIHTCLPDSVKDSVLCAPAGILQEELNGEWKRYPAAPVKSAASEAQAGKNNEVKDKLKHRKKIIAAILAFPLPGGIFGAHRIYL